MKKLSTLLSLITRVWGKRREGGNERGLVHPNSSIDSKLEFFVWENDIDTKSESDIWNELLKCLNVIYAGLEIFSYNNTTFTQLNKIEVKDFSVK